LKKKKRGLNFLGIDPTLGIGDKILDYAEGEKERLDKSNYHAVCPSCGKRQLKNNLLESGCFICGWRGGAEEVELAKVRKSFSISVGLDKGCGGYKTRCPSCGAFLITEEFKARGCYICGYNEE
jgi:hypothetical protein